MSLDTRHQVNAKDLYQRRINSRVNRVQMTCDCCGLPVPALGGTEFEAVINPCAEVEDTRTFTLHIACAVAGTPSVRGLRGPDGEVVQIQNVLGRCEDAPCCGCCYP